MSSAHIWYQVTTARASLCDFSVGRGGHGPVRDFAISENHCFGVFFTKMTDFQIMTVISHDFLLPSKGD
jgi:hypothetical protein